MSTLPSLKESLKKVQKDRKTKGEVMETMSDDGWNVEDNRKTSYTCPSLSTNDTPSLLIFTRMHKLVDIFLHFLSPDLINLIIKNRLAGCTAVFIMPNQKRINVTLHKIYKY